MKINVPKIWNKKYQYDINNQLKPNLFLLKNINNFLKLLNKKAKILDLGCGTGNKTNFIHKKGFNIIGIDSSERAISYAKNNYKNMQFYKGNILNTKFADNSFDAIISTAVMHCLIKSQRLKYIKEIKRLLKKNGILFQLVLSSEDQTKIQQKQIETNTFIDKYGLVFHLFTEKELKDYFKDFQFIKFKLNKKKFRNKTIAVYTMILKKISKK